MKIAFFDRDGTIIKDYPDENWSAITQPEFLPGAIETLQQVMQKGFKIIIITNQYLINEGYISLEQYEEINREMLEVLTRHDVDILDVFYCPHGRREGCDCCKPQTGMIRQAIDKYPAIDLNESFIIGDSLVDMELAIRIDIVGFGINVEVPVEAKDIYRIEEVIGVLQFIN
ncbi:HAD-IIIA family hydrolase [Sporosarcina sp. Marseille-Q4943]|uniref:D-glycero-alpha-D-manno-heptose-1,7-bisphosphate 7-phosphatase n=1 Tax=Sporosarcina sp. Marseille-Q4943 TaxID=2942204 RepID=UPI00208DA4DE|nr:HAD-IIIA family hydrolase [Sporosarcina sp. Marseille-Q4943]